VMVLLVLASLVCEDDAERVLRVAIEWGRYAEHFAYEEGSGMLSLENPESLPTKRKSD